MVSAVSACGVVVPIQRPATNRNDGKRPVFLGGNYATIL